MVIGEPVTDFVPQSPVSTRELLETHPGVLIASAEDLVTEPLPSGLDLPPLSSTVVTLAHHHHFDVFGEDFYIAGRSGATQAGLNIERSPDQNGKPSVRITNYGHMIVHAPAGAEIPIAAAYSHSSTPTQGRALDEFVEDMVMLEDDDPVKRPFVVRAGELGQGFDGVVLPVEYVFDRISSVSDDPDAITGCLDLSRMPRGTRREELYAAIQLDPNAKPIEEARHNHDPNSRDHVVSATQRLRLALSSALVIQTGFATVNGVVQPKPHFNCDLLKSESSKGRIYDFRLKFENFGLPDFILVYVYNDFSYLRAPGGAELPTAQIIAETSSNGHTTQTFSAD